MERKKIVLDADVLIHFAKAGYLNVLPSILPEYEYIVLSVVYDEVRSIQQQIDRQIEFLKNIRKVQFEPTGEMRREYAMLTSRFGRGESACMAYCRFTDDVIFAFEGEFKVEGGIERGCFEDLASAESAEGRRFGVGIPEEIRVNFSIYGTVIDVTFAT